MLDERCRRPNVQVSEQRELELGEVGVGEVGVAAGDAESPTRPGAG